MIVEWRVCVDCGARFGLTPRQCNAGLRAQTRRCAAHRAERRRERARLRALRFRQRRRNAGSAVVHALAAHEAFHEASEAA